MNKRLYKHCNQTGVFPESKNGRNERSTVDGMRWLRLVTEYRKEMDLPTYFTFYGFAAARVIHCFRKNWCAAVNAKGDHGIALRN